MKFEAPFLPHPLEQADRQQARADQNDLWGREIVPIDCECSLLLLDQDINRDMKGTSRQLKKLRQHSLIQPRPTSSRGEKNMFAMLHEVGCENKVTPLTNQPGYVDLLDLKLEEPTSSAKSRKISNKETSVSSGKVLPQEFQPLPYSVIVGKGKESKNVVGNERLRVLASSYLTRYAAASHNRQTKSDLVSQLIASIRTACPIGAFIKLCKDGRWYEVSDTSTREKVGYVFRDMLGDKYRSSSKAKVAMRRLKRRRFSRQEHFNLVGGQ